MSKEELEARIAALELENQRLREGAGWAAERTTEVELRRFRDIVAGSPSFIGMATPDGKGLYINPAGLKMAGHPLDLDVTQVAMADFHPPEILQRIFSEALAVVQEGGTWQSESELLHRDGTRIPVLQVFMAHRDHSGEIIHLTSVMHDLRETKRLERLANRKERLESIGRLAGGVAHDFNNLLTVIDNCTGFAVDQLPSDSRAREDLEQVLVASRRAADLCSQLLSFARRQIIRPTVLDIRSVVDELTRLFRRTLGEDVVLTTHLPDGLWPIRVDRAQLDQVLMNLVINARQAMPAGGELVIEARNTVLDEAYAAEHPEVTTGDYLMIAVSDTGEGMPAEVRRRIFEPFFSTKGSEGGSGLGLATVHGAVRQNGGFIWLYSEPGQGTTFKIYWPRSAAKAAPAVPPPAPARNANGTVLVVEDEPLLRKLTVRILEDAGYDVLQAEDGPTALALVAETERSIELLVTDVVMPHMTGKELADRLRTQRPALLVLFVSGYTENTIVHHGVLEDVEFLAKPFSRAELLDRVGQLLEDPRG